MKAVPIIAALAGLAVVAGLVAGFGADAVIHSFLALGWKGFGAICLLHLSLLGVMGIAWRVLVPGALLRTFMAARVVREAGSEVLPLSPIGGCVLGARVLTLAGIPGSTAAASTIVDLTLEFFAKLAYTALGLVLLISLRPGSAITAPLTAGLAAASLAGLGLYSGAAPRVWAFRPHGPCSRTGLGRANRSRRRHFTRRPATYLSAKVRPTDWLDAASLLLDSGHG